MAGELMPKNFSVTLFWCSLLSERNKKNNGCVLPEQVMKARLRIVVVGRLMMTQP